MPHTPHDSPERYQRRFDEGKIPKPKRAYYAAIAQFDDTVGELIQMIESRGLADDTLFVFVIDNGFEPLPEKPSQYTKESKRSPFEPGTRTPILLRFDDRIEPGIRRELVSSLDLFPTILSSAAIAIESRPPGVDLWPNALSSKARLDPHRAIYGAIYPGDATQLGDASIDVAYRWIRRGPLKLILPTSDSPWNGYVNGPSLFDLSVDPHETENLSDGPRYAQRLGELVQLLDAWWKPNR